jgi:DHA1 family tetracycline resistance protein-like MFS transporter
MAYVADVTPPEGRTKSYSWLNSAAWTGVILGPALGGLLAAGGLRVPFWAAAAFAFANGIYGYFVLPESLAPQNRAPLRWSKANPWGALRLLVERRGLFVLGLILLMLWFAGYALNSLFVLYTAYRYGWSPLNLGVFLSIVAAANIVVQTGLASRAANWIGDKGVMVAGLALQVVGFTLVGLAPTSMLFWIANAPIALGNIAGPSLQSLMTAKVEADEQGRLQGAMGAVGSLTGFVAPVAFTQLFAWAIGLGQGPGWSGLPILIGAAFSLVAWGLAVAAARASPGD